MIAFLDLIAVKLRILLTSEYVGIGVAFVICESLDYFKIGRGI